MNHEMKQWIVATRPWSFPASVMPAIVTISFFFCLSRTQELSGNFDWINGILAVVGVVLFHMSGNLISDYFDYRKGVDRKETFGSSRMLVDGVFSPREIFLFGIVSLVMGVALGLILVARTGLELLPIGIAGVIACLFYYKFKYVALGDLMIFIVFGILIALGTAFVMTGEVYLPILFVSAPIGFLIVNILHANNTRDIFHDGKAHIRTSAMLMGIKASKVKYALLASLSYGWVVVLVLMQRLSPFCLLIFITLPVMVKGVKLMNMAEIERPEIIKDLDGHSAKLVLLFSMLFAVSNFLTPLVW